MKFRKVLSSLLAGTMLLGSISANAVTVETDDTPKRSGVAVEQESSSVTVTSNKTAHGLPAKLEDGTILHAWCWSCNTITANMKDIADAGYTAIQTSPMQQSYARYSDKNTLMGQKNDADATDGTEGAWWWQYQPTAQKLGNYQFFSKPDNYNECCKEYEAMCDAADAYGISIITDIVSNHTTSHYVLREVTDETTGEKVLAENKSGQIDISSDMTTAVGDYNSLWHTGTAFNENKTGVEPRMFLINYMNGSLPDINTENTNYQAYVVKYLNKLVELGCDGFRFDTAHHIGISDIDGSSYNFWEAVTGVNSVNDIQGNEVKLGRFTNSADVSPDDLFIYGEMIKSEYADGYTKKIRITDFDYGKTVRSAVHNNSISTGSIMNKESTNLYKINGVSCNNVTWVESHDDYCNADKNTGVHASAFLTEEDIKFSWAIITARKAGTPLYFNRPDGSNALNNNFWGNNVAGAKGNDAFKDPEVAAVNKFRNAMAIAGADGEYMWNIDNNSKVLQIDRYNNSDNVPGKCGTVIVNLSSNDKDIDTPTNIAIGNYFDSVSGDVFEVYDNNGTNYIKGHIYGRKTAVIYMTPEQYDAVYNTDDNYSLSEKNYVYFFNTFGKTDIKVSLSGKSAQPMIWSDALHCYYYEYPAESVSSVVFTTSGEDSSDTYSYTAPANYKPGMLYVPTGIASGEVKALTDIKTDRVYLNVQDNNWSHDNVKAYLYDSDLRVNAAYPGDSMTYLGNNVCGLTGDLYSCIYYYIEGANYSTVKFVNNEGYLYRTSGTTMSDENLWTISTSTSKPATVTGSSLSSSVSVEENKSITVNYKYYDREVGNSSQNILREKTINQPATTSDLETVIANAVGAFKLNNLYDKTSCYTSQFAYITEIASYYDSESERNDGLTYAGRINPRHLSNKTSSFSGLYGTDVGNLSVSGENWVTYYNGNNPIDPNDVLPNLSNVTSITIWGFNKPHTYQLSMHYPKRTNEIPTISVGSGNLLTSKSFSGSEIYSCTYNQLPTESGVNPASNIVTPQNLMFDGWYALNFNGNVVTSYVKVSSQQTYNFRVTKNLELYAVYKPISTQPRPKAASVTANSVDSFLNSEGTTSYHFNTMLNIFNCEENDAKITDVGIVYIPLSSSASVNYSDIKTALSNNDVIGNGTKRGTAGSYTYDYHQYSVENNKVNLTNKNRIQFIYTLTQDKLSGTYSNVAVLSVFKYDGQWIVSNNCIQYKYTDSKVVSNECIY